jgi:hypothetical protein
LTHGQAICSSLEADSGKPINTFPSTFSWTVNRLGVQLYDLVLVTDRSKSCRQEPVVELPRSDFVVPTQRRTRKQKNCSPYCPLLGFHSYSLEMKDLLLAVVLLISRNQQHGVCITIGEDSGGGNFSAVIDVVHISNVETGMRWNQLVQIVGHAVLPQEAGAAALAA